MMEPAIQRERDSDLALLPDAVLLTAFAAEANDHAFAALLRRHGPLVLGVCRRILRNAADADDAFQATFLVLAMRARKETPRSLGAWLHQVATRTSLAMKSRAARQSALERMLMRLGRIKSVSEPADVESRLVLDEQINLLPKRYREVVVLCFLGGKSKREAAIELGWAEGTVSSRLNHARMLLRRRLQRLGFGASEENVTDSLTRGMGVAAVPASLTSSTLQAARAIVAGKVTAGVISSKVLMVAKGVAKPMLLTKANIAVGVILFSAAAIAVPAAVSHIQTVRKTSDPTSASVGSSATSLMPHGATPQLSSRLDGSLSSSRVDTQPNPLIARAPEPSSFEPVGGEPNQPVATDQQHAVQAAPAHDNTTQPDAADPRHIISGRVIQIDGTPVGRARVFIAPTEENLVGRRWEGSVAADASGHFQITGCTGEYLLRAFSLNRSVTRSAIHVSAGDEVTLQLAPNSAPMITGRVLDSDGKPIHVPPRQGGFGAPKPGSALLKRSNVRIHVLIEITPGSGSFRVMLWTPEPEMADDEGNFSVTGFFPDARCRILVEADGYEHQMSPIQEAVKPGQTINLAQMTLKQN
jgi:RNA polymerase sigma factor (sigma-70 family)